MIIELHFSPDWFHWLEIILENQSHLSEIANRKRSQMVGILREIHSMGFVSHELWTANSEPDHRQWSSVWCKWQSGKWSPFNVTEQLKSLRLQLRSALQVGVIGGPSTYKSTKVNQIDFTVLKFTLDLLRIHTRTATNYNYELTL